jgi:hypothetical protein
MRSNRMVLRPDGLTAVFMYAPGNGELAFTAAYTRDWGPVMHGQSRYKYLDAAEDMPPTLNECLQLLPVGWVAYPVGNNWRARPAKEMRYG